MMNILLVIILLVFGILLLVAEMFLLPGFGIAGISGFACLAGSVVVAYLKISALAGRITLLACVILAAVAVWGFLRSKTLKKMSLDTTIESKVDLAAPGKKIETLEAEAEKMTSNR